MRSEWTAKPLTEVVSLQRGFDLPTPSRRAGTVPVLGSFGVTGWHDESRARGPGVTVGRSGASMGVTTYSLVDYWPLNTTLFVTDFHGNDPRWIFHLFQTLDLTGFNSGSVQPMLNRNYIAKVPVLLPPTNDQRRIAGVLSAFDDLIDTNRSAVRRVLDLSRALFSDVARNAEAEVRLGEVAVVNPDKVTVGAPDEPLRYLDIAGLEDGSSVTPPKTRWVDAPSRARRGAKEGDTLWATVRPNRRGHVLLTPKPDHLVVSTGIAVLRPVEIGPAFLFAATDDEFFSEHLTQRADGSAYPAVRADAFKDALIPLPEKTELERFERTMWPIWQAAGELLSEAAELQSIRDELLPLLMSGLITVDEAWEAVS